MSYEEDMAAARTAMRKLMQTECEELNILIPMLDRIIALREARNRPVVLFRDARYEAAGVRTELLRVLATPEVQG